MHSRYGFSCFIKVLEEYGKIDGYFALGEEDKERIRLTIRRRKLSSDLPVYCENIWDGGLKAWFLN